MSVHHVIKFTHRDGKPLELNEAWCGDECHGFEWAFLDAQHALLSLESGDHCTIDICRDCLRAMSEVLAEELGKANREACIPPR